MKTPKHWDPTLETDGPRFGSFGTERLLWLLLVTPLIPSIATYKLLLSDCKSWYFTDGPTPPLSLYNLVFWYSTLVTVIYLWKVVIFHSQMLVYQVWIWDFADLQSQLEKDVAGQGLNHQLVMVLEILHWDPWLSSMRGDDQRVDDDYLGMTTKDKVEKFQLDDDFDYDNCSGPKEPSLTSSD